MFFFYGWELCTSKFQSIYNERFALVQELWELYRTRRWELSQPAFFHPIRLHLALLPPSSQTEEPHVWIRTRQQKRLPKLARGSERRNYPFVCFSPHTEKIHYSFLIKRTLGRWAQWIHSLQKFVLSFAASCVSFAQGREKQSTFLVVSPLVARFSHSRYGNA